MRIIGPDDEGEALEPGSEIILPGTDYTKQSRTIFTVSESHSHEELLEVEEQVEEESFQKARAYFRKRRKLTYELIPDHIKGDEGRRFLKIAGALATAGAGAYIIVKKRSKK